MPRHPTAYIRIRIHQDAENFVDLAFARRPEIAAQ